MINAAKLGYGTVGSGVFEVIRTNQKSISKRIGKELRVKYVLDKKEFPADDPVNEVLCRNFETIVNDPEISIVVEVLGGVEPSYTWVSECLKRGKSVCTSNKELVAKHGAELIALAKENDANFLFEASVGGGIPIIRPINESLSADEITEITGILNGTTNYILTKMSDEGLDFDAVLKEAQEKGYAELHPEADVEGYDACRKIAILTSLAYGQQVDYPMMIGKDHPLYSVKDVFNAVFVNGNMVDDLMFYGRGAGKLPTASAVAADMVEAVRHLGRSLPIIWSSEKLELGNIGDFKHAFFVRVSADTPKEAVEKAFGNVKIVTLEEKTDEYAFVTSIIKEKDFQKKIKDFKSVNSVIRLNAK